MIDEPQKLQTPPVYSGHCPRCGEEHKGLPLALLANPPEVSSARNGSALADAWTMCPVLQQPLLVGWIKQTVQG